MVNLDISQDFTVFDNTQTLLFDNGSGPVDIAGCTSGPLNRKQLQQIGNIGAEVVMRSFSLPIANFASVPRNGDKLTDQDRVLWIIQSADKNTLNTRWLCVCERSAA